MKKFATMAISIGLIGTMVAGGSLAYLSDTASDVNVMTLGSVNIEQIEQERNAEGKLVDFTQAKPAYPAVGEVKWDDTKLTVNEVAYNVYDDGLKNVVDKIVTVKNTGKSDAYVRTLIAIEQPEGTDNLVHVNMNTDGVTSAELGAVVINGTRYAVTSHTYDAALAPKAISAPSLMQLFLDKAADNKDCEKFGDTWDVLVLSQAVQTAGFDTAATALNEAFGELNEMNVKKWFGAPVIPTVYEVSTNEELKAALTANDDAIVVTLNADVAYDVAAWDNNAMGGSNTQEILIEGHGHTITFNNTNSDWNNVVTNGAKLVIKDATITNSGHNATSGTWNGHDITFNCDVELNNVKVLNAIAVEKNAELNNVTITDDSTGDAYMLWIRTTAENVVLNNCVIDATGTEGSDRGIKIADEYLNEEEKVTVNLTANDTKFITERKAAILVTATKGANITLNNVDIAGVYDDKVNAVWVDEARADYADKVNVKGGSVIVEGTVVVANATQLNKAVADGATRIQLKAGEYNTNDISGLAGKTLTISGDKNAIIKLNNRGEDGCDYAFGGNGTGVGNVTFNGITIDTTSNTGNYKGFAYMKGTFNNCNFVGAYSLNNANDFVFTNCTFDFKNGYFWTWGAKSVTFDNCVFNGNSKAILAHGSASTVITIDDCKFAATEKGYTGAGDNTAVVEIDPVGTNTYTINWVGNNTKTDSYAGWTRVKDASTGHIGLK